MQSAEAHALLADRDPQLPGLRALLDDEVLSAQLGLPTRRSYVRYKPGTSAVALVDVDGRAAIAHAWGAAAPEKRAKALRDVEPDDVLLDRADDGLLVVDAMADRRVPALRTLVRSGRVHGWLARRGYPPVPDARPQTLAHKPSRRWVGRLPLVEPGQHVVLRAYERRGFDSALAAHGLVDPSAVEPLRLPRVIGTHRRGLIALEHLRGTPLAASASTATLRRLGAALGALHASGPSGVLDPGPAGVDAPGALEPVVGGLPTHIARIAEEASAALRPGAGAVLHGDFSLDQVVVDGSSLGLIDLDRVRRGQPLDDVASLLAQAALTELPATGTAGARRLMDRMRDPVLAGHATTWTAGTSDDLGPRTALALLSRAGEPFRTGAPDWPATTTDLVELAGELARDRAAA